jgi:hypothetical protein
MGMNYIPNIKSKDEFWIRFLKLYNYLNFKEKKSIAEEQLCEVLSKAKYYIDTNTHVYENKESFCNMLPYFELGGGWEMMQSDIGKEATDLLHYFAQNY